MSTETVNHFDGLADKVCYIHISKNFNFQLFDGVSGYGNYKHFNSPKEAIEEMLKNPLIDTIFCDIEFLMDFINIKQNHNKENTIDLVPFILCVKDYEKVNTKEILSLKVIDEVYCEKTNGINSLINRISFIKDFKRKKINKEINLHKSSKTRKTKVREADIILKRFIDIVFSLLGIVMFSPIFLLIAILIKLDSKGSVFYVSKRVGSNFNIFYFYKFRTMVVDADKRVKELKGYNQYNNEYSNNATFFKVKDDPRITNLGKFLRYTSLDELPQLFNVLKGDMSLVGNRPLPIYEANSLTRDEWVERFLAPAGITGLWQISKRGKDEMSVDDRIALDIEYASNFSFFKDLDIMMKTLPAMIQTENV